MAVAASIPWINRRDEERTTLKKFWAYLSIAFVCGVVATVAANRFGVTAESRWATYQPQPTPNSEAAISEKRPDAETRWASFENPLAQKGAAASENQGAK